MRQSDYGQIVEEAWLQTAVVRANVTLDAFIMMPNHFHGIIVLIDEFATVASTAMSQAPVPHIQGVPTALPHSPPSGALGAIVAQVKASVTKWINRLPTPSIAFAWQRNYFEQIIRDDDQLNHIRDYITQTQRVGRS